jgi:hypothetical protein
MQLFSQINSEIVKFEMMTLTGREKPDVANADVVVGYIL